jgi:hypothetical protein
MPGLHCRAPVNATPGYDVPHGATLAGMQFGYAYAAGLDGKFYNSGELDSTT